MTNRAVSVSPAVAWCAARAGGVSLTVKVQPRASRTEIAGESGGALRVKVHSAPVDGKANEELRRFLAQRLGVAPSALTVARGESARHKVLWVTGITVAQAAARLGAAGRD